jgi:hypothetical protein
MLGRSLFGDLERMTKGGSMFGHRGRLAHFRLADQSSKGCWFQPADVRNWRKSPMILTLCRSAVDRSGVRNTPTCGWHGKLVCSLGHAS